jgi:hypothetical protein
MKVLVIHGDSENAVLMGRIISELGFQNDQATNQDEIKVAMARIHEYRAVVVCSGKLHDTAERIMFQIQKHNDGIRTVIMSLDPDLMADPQHGRKKLAGNFCHVALPVLTYKPQDLIKAINPYREL